MGSSGSRSAVDPLRMAEAERRLEQALVGVGAAGEAARTLLERAGLAVGPSQRMADVVKLEKAFRGRRMIVEAGRLRTYIDAAAEVYSARQSVEALRSRPVAVDPPPAEEPFDSFGDAVRELAADLFPAAPPTGGADPMEPGTRWRSKWVGRTTMPPVEPWHRTTPPWEEKPRDAPCNGA